MELQPYVNPVNQMLMLKFLFFAFFVPIWDRAAFSPPYLPDRKAYSVCHVNKAENATGHKAFQVGY